MPAPEESHAYQAAVLFPILGSDSYGKPVVGTPREIRVRWLTGRKKALTGKGETIILDCSVGVNEVIDIGSRMWLGELTDWLGTGSAEGVLDQELMEVKTYDETPDLKNRYGDAGVGLMRLHNKLQT